MTTSQVIHVGLLSADPEMAAWFCEDIGCVEENDSQNLTFSNRHLSFHPAPSEEGEVADSAAGKFDLFVALVRFVDVLSLQTLSKLLTSSGAINATPTLLLFYRNENEKDFKMSCPYCGQKLWVRDVDQDKRGRCPDCSKSFTLPEQKDHIVSVLRLPPSIEVKKITRQDAGSFAAPLRQIIQLASIESSLQNLDIDKNSFINDTMKVNVVDE